MHNALSSFPLSPDTLLPELLARHPEARSVFDKYGLAGCGGRLGPQESIRFFSRAHGVEESQLVTELQAAITGAADGLRPRLDLPSVADTIYRRFFLAGIAIVLTAGATWGAWLLWQIGYLRNFTGVSLHEINAHGHAQIFGWVGLFIIGFSSQAFPRFWHTKLAAPRLSVFVFVSMLAGIAMRTGGMAEPGTSWGLSFALGGGVIEILAIAVFAGQLLATFLKSEARVEPYIVFVFTAVGFFIVQAVFSVWHMNRLMTAATQEALIAQVATWQSPLRDLQIHGLALFMIIGVNMRMLPALYEVPKLSKARAWTAYGIMLAAVLGEVAIFILYRLSGNQLVAALLMIPWLMLVAGCLTVAWPWKLWRPLRTPDGSPDRTAKFIRASWAWLAVSLAMLLMLPVYQAASGIPFSHSYYGAIRHAITVGFISLMIMGFASRVVPTLAGIDLKTLPALWLPFWLVNVGCFLRVSTQTLTDWYPASYTVIGVSGTLEVIGLAIWGTHLGRIMIRSRRAEREENQEEDAGARPPFIGAHHTPALVIGWFPETVAVFDRYGLGVIRNPVLRRIVARRLTLAQAAAMHDVPLQEFLGDLNLAVRERRKNARDDNTAIEAGN